MGLSSCCVDSPTCHQQNPSKQTLTVDPPHKPQVHEARRRRGKIVLDIAYYWVAIHPNLRRLESLRSHKQVYLVFWLVIRLPSTLSVPHASSLSHLLDRNFGSWHFSFASTSRFLTFYPVVMVTRYPRCKRYPSDEKPSGYKRSVYLQHKECRQRAEVTGARVSICPRVQTLKAFTWVSLTSLTIKCCVRASTNLHRDSSIMHNPVIVSFPWALPLKTSPLHFNPYSLRLKWDEKAVWRFAWAILTPDWIKTCRILSTVWELWEAINFSVHGRCLLSGDRQHWAACRERSRQVNGMWVTVLIGRGDAWLPAGGNTRNNKVSFLGEFSCLRELERWKFSLLSPCWCPEDI